MSDTRVFYPRKATCKGNKQNTIMQILLAHPTGVLDVGNPVWRCLSDARAVRPYNLPIISSASMQESNDTAHNFLPRSLTDAPT